MSQNRTLHDTIMALRRTYRMKYEEIMQHWKQYSTSAMKYHKPDAEEFHILMMMYKKNNIIMSFEDFVDYQIYKEGGLTFDEVLL